MGGLRFGFQMGVVPIYASLKRSSEVLDFYGKNLVRSSLTFVAEIRHRLSQVTQIVTITPKEDK